MKKVMFSDRFGLTKAVIEGRKTMTRRIMNPQPAWWRGDGVPLSGDISPIRQPFKVGEVVAVAQSYHALNKAGFIAPEWCEHTCEDSPGYENKMFVRADLMPYQIRITNVRVERMQDISDEDCLKEGITKPTFDTFTFDGWKYFAYNPREAFAALIDKVSGKGTWERNPWVFVYEFELVK